MRCILIGLPGSGKGTQAAVLAAKFGIAHISTGDMMRAAMERGSNLGLRARKAMESGELVSDDIVIGLVSERVREPDCRDGFVVDGFPRTVEQAVAAYTTGGFQAVHGVAGGGLAVGAPADFVVVDGHPMSATSRVVETWIDGRLAWSAAGRTASSQTV